MDKKKVLFIGGSLNQTSQGYAVAQHLEPEFDCYFTPYYCDGFLNLLASFGLLDFTVIGGRFREQTENFMRQHNLKVDYRGEGHDYDLVVTGSDLIIQHNIRNKRVLLLQEGMTDPEDLIYQLVKKIRFPRYLASTSTTGLSDAYDVLCVASEGYRDLFIRKGVKPEKIVVTGIPNFDNIKTFHDNDFPFYHHVLVATSDARETFKRDNRKKLIQHAVEIANGRLLIFKLHPNERFESRVREILDVAPDALVFTGGNINPMIANCDVLITQYSSVAYIGLALGKEVYSYFDVEELKRLLPIQNNGTSAKKIANVCKLLLEAEDEAILKDYQIVHAD
jgi:hypothetical protein